MVALEGGEVPESSPRWSDSLLMSPDRCCAAAAAATAAAAADAAATKADAAADKASMLSRWATMRMQQWRAAGDVCLWYH
jgi:hypothetical protein